jgi:hypothetical protein
MAKMKTFAVEVEITLTRTFIVEARRPGGAEEKALTDEGWSEAIRYVDPAEHDVLWGQRKNARVVRVREVGT